MTEDNSGQEPRLPQICYGLAYFLLPQMLFSNPEKTLGYFRSTQFPPGAYLYAMACSAQTAKPQREDALLFHTHIGLLPGNINYSVLEYPVPPPFNLSSRAAVLAPHFSACVQRQPIQAVSYYILGQAPLGGTTLRTVQPDSTNVNLGPGPSPTLADFLDILQGKI